jgi:hypothetical protein
VTAATLLTLAADSEVLVRRAAVEALLTALARAPEHGLETYVATSAIDRRGQILLVRTIRDLRDTRAASYLFAVAASDDPRLARDALGVMRIMRASLIARRYLWAGPEQAAPWPGRAALLTAVRATLTAAAAPAEATAFAAHLAGALGDMSVLEPLRARLRAGLPGAGATPIGDAATTASAADALASLAPDGLGCDLTRLLARLEPDLQELVPSRLLELAEADEPVRSETRRCLREAVATGATAVPALWITAALGDASMVTVVREALGRERADERRAAAWALGELPFDAAAAAALRERAASDPDEIVRRLARGAYSKQAGERPRTLPHVGFAGFPETGTPGYKTKPLGDDPGVAEGPA